MPLARFTLLEPSEQMADFCRQRIAALHAGSRCLLHQQSLADSGLEPAGFDAVVCHHVLHLFRQPNQQIHFPEQQQQQLDRLLGFLPAGSSSQIARLNRWRSNHCLLLSS